MTFDTSPPMRRGGPSRAIIMGKTDIRSNTNQNLPNNCIFSELRTLINVVDELRDVGVSEIVKLPRIAVIGSQSAGKSSVLESIVGFDFLPRGEGVVTRMPLELRLVHVPEPRKNVQNSDTQSSTGSLIADAVSNSSSARSSTHEINAMETRLDGGSLAGSQESTLSNATDLSLLSPSNQLQNHEIKAVFGHAPNTVYTDLSEVRDHIIAYTDSIAGTNKGIIDQSIVLTISGQTLPDLTLIDLPGVTRVPLRDSDQSDDIEELTRNMSLRFISDSRTIILAVIPANQDVSTSDGLLLARRVDPDGLRTLGVITKLDIMDRGLDAMSMLKGEQVPLRLGYSAVICRSSADIADNIDIETARRKESTFFARHPVYGRYFEHPAYKSQMGMKSLIERLTNVLFAHIRQELPKIRLEISEMLEEYKAREKVLGGGVPDTDLGKLQLVHGMVHDFSQLVSNSISGRHDRRMESAAGACSGAVIRQYMFELLRDPLLLPVEEEPTLSSDKIMDALSLHEGDSLPGLPSPQVFEYLVKPLLDRLDPPVLELLERVYYCVDDLLEACSTIVFDRFPVFKQYVLDNAREDLDLCYAEAVTVVKSILRSEKEYIFTNSFPMLQRLGDKVRQGNLEMNVEDMHDAGNNQRCMEDEDDALQMALLDEVSRNTSMAQQVGAYITDAGGKAISLVKGVTKIGSRGLEAPMVEDGGMEVRYATTPYTETLISAFVSRVYGYVHVVSTSVKDSVPKAIGCFLVRSLQEKLHPNLSARSTHEMESLGTMLEEPTPIAIERREVAEKIAILTNATHVLNKEGERGNQVGLDVGRASRTRAAAPPPTRVSMSHMTGPPMSQRGSQVSSSGPNMSQMSQNEGFKTNKESSLYPLPNRGNVPPQMSQKPNLGHFNQRHNPYIPYNSSQNGDSESLHSTHSPPLNVPNVPNVPKNRVSSPIVRSTDSSSHLPAVGGGAWNSMDEVGDAPKAPMNSRRFGKFGARARIDMD